MAKLPIAGLEVFLAIAEHGSLRAAARALGVGPPAVSHQLKSFEQRLGVSLYTRTSRCVQLTDAGHALLGRAGPATAELADALNDVQGLAHSKKGSIRITLPYGAYRLALAPRLAAFRSRYPEIELELSFEEAFIDLVAERFHAGVRLGDTIQQDMIAVRLTPPLMDAFFASPVYLDSSGRPDEPPDLLQHNCIRYRYITSKRLYDWRFKGPSGDYSVAVSGTLTVNSFEAAVEAARQGVGIAQNFRQEIESDISAHRLETVLDEHTLQRPGFFLYYPSEYSRLEILRLFVDFVRI